MDLKPSRLGTEQAITRMTEAPATYGDFIIRGTSKWENRNFEAAVVEIFNDQVSFGEEIPEYTSDPESLNYTGIATGIGGPVYAHVNDLNTLRVAYENLRSSYEALLAALLNQGIVTNP